MLPLTRMITEKDCQRLKQDRFDYVQFEMSKEGEK